jgi:transposase
MPESAPAGTPSERTIGIDVGDTWSQICVVDANGTVIEEARVRTTTRAMQRRFAAPPARRVVLEVGTHSPWLSRLLVALGHEVIVANPGRVRLIAASMTKHDRGDAEHLARLGRIDPALLAPVRHRGAPAQRDLAVIRARDSLVRARTGLINHARQAVKSQGGRLPPCAATAFARKALPAIPDALVPVLTPHLTVIADLTAQIAQADRDIVRLGRKSYPETQLLQQVAGVGPLIALTFILTIDDPDRFPTSRAVGAYLGLVPRQRASGQRQPQLRITKAGDHLLRRLLIGAAHYVLGPFGPDTDLRRWGLRYAPPGSRNAKKRAITAVARRLAVLLHRLWVTGEVYEPLRQAA